MNQITTIARNTFREAIRDRIFHSLLAFAGLMLLSSLVLSYVTVGEKARIVMDVGLASIHLFGALIAISVGTGLVYKEISKRTIYTLLSKPVTRTQFVVGKYLGLVAVLFVQLVVMAVFFHALFLWNGGWYSWTTIAAIFLIGIELMVITAAVLFFSTFAGPFTAGVLGLLFFIMGHAVAAVSNFTKLYTDQEPSPIFDRVMFLIPNLEYFNLKAEALYRHSVGLGPVLLATAFGLVLSAGFVTFAALTLARRDFT